MLKEGHSLYMDIFLYLSLWAISQLYPVSGIAPYSSIHFLPFSLSVICLPVSFPSSSINFLKNKLEGRASDASDLCFCIHGILCSLTHNSASFSWQREGRRVVYIFHMEVFVASNSQ